MATAVVLIRRVTTYQHIEISLASTEYEVSAMYSVNQHGYTIEYPIDYRKEKIDEGITHASFTDIPPSELDKMRSGHK